MEKYKRLSREKLLDLIYEKDLQISNLLREIEKSNAQRIQQRITSLHTVMETVLNHIPVAIAVKSVADGFRHVYFNQAAEAFTGISSENVVGYTDFEIFSDEEYAKKVRGRDMKTLQDGEFSQYAINYKNPKGEERIVNLIRLLVNADKTPLIISMIWDITEQRQSEIDLMKVREADAIKSAFLANMSHEIRTPLNAIVGFSSVLADTTDEEERKCYIEIINRNNEMLLHLINDILDFSKIESDALTYHLERVDLKDICQHLYLIYSMKMHPGVKMEFGANELPSVILNTDSKRIIQVISNLLSNAVKFTLQGTISLHYEKGEDWVRISVSDTGIGITEANKKSIFNSFVKIDDFQQGVGLGLPISKSIVEKLGGKIGVDSELGKGSNFWFTLPLNKKMQLKNYMQFNLPQEGITNIKQSILIAEDVEENYYLLNVIFGKEYNLYHAHTGVEAVQMFKQYNPSIILMDIKMPEMDGFEASQAIRKLSSTVPIFALTAFSQDQERKKAKECRINEYITKPIDITLLKETVKKYLTEISDSTTLHCS
ncbi:PAS domain-containing hybrid sensor histidine kinase/response regulator [Parabacteroides pacaensis]|uniref:PAS domain-containing hybrid sensor histidine kinase/response regulator n=1 Tax=Parabacteroides pacaensis TaxID=2086575 RepID=UPI000D0FFC1D|nr:ATP-binding protein [Parabacteroides pacaensis]